MNKSHQKILFLPVYFFNTVFSSNSYFRNAYGKIWLTELWCDPKILILLNTLLQKQAGLHPLSNIVSAALVEEEKTFMLLTFCLEKNRVHFRFRVISHHQPWQQHHSLFTILTLSGPESFHSFKAKILCIIEWNYQIDGQNFITSFSYVLTWHLVFIMKYKVIL